MFSLEGKVALVTGGGRGIGQALAVGLARQGADLVIAGRTEATLHDTARRIRELGRRALPVVADIGRMADIERLLRTAVEHFGRIGILVNNAASSAALKRAESWTPEEFDELVAVNLRGTFFLTTAVAREMITHGGGSIINISSVMGQVAAPRAAVYAATKGAMDALTRTLAVEWARFGIRVNGVAPGYVQSDMTAGISADARAGEYIRSRTPVGRLGRDDEIVGAVVYLAADEASYQTGETIRVDGGWAAW